MTKPSSVVATAGAPARSSRGIRLKSLLPGGALALALLLFAALGLRLIDVGAADLAVVGLFSTDEQLAGQLIRAMLLHNNLGLSHFYSYGPLDLYAARLALWPWALRHSVPDAAIITTLRAVSLLAGLGCIAISFVLGRRLWDSTTGALAAILLAMSPTTLAWSTTAHPDMLQLFWLLLGLLCAVRLISHRSRQLLMLGAVCASLAFATKYEGELLLPLLWLADLLGLLNARPKGGLPLGALLAAFASDAALSLALFAACFLLLDPSVLRERHEFLYQARLEAGLAHTGHLFRLSGGGVAWLGALAGADVLGPVLLAIGLAATAGWTAISVRATVPAARTGALSGAARAQERLLLAFWTAGYLLFLFVWIADRQPRYALPALPGLAIFAAAALVGLARRRPAAVLASALMVLTVAPVLPATLRYERAMAGRMSEPLVRRRIEAGQWLAARTPANISLIADAYAYLPTSLTNVRVTFGLTQAEIAADRPQIIVTDAAIRDRFRDPSDAGRYVDGAQAYEQVAATYDALDAGQLACYPLRQRSGPESIYGLLPGEPRPAGC